MSVQIIAPHRQYGFKLNKLPDGGTGTGGGAIEPPRWHNLINMKIWGSDGAGDDPQNYGTMLVSKGGQGLFPYNPGAIGDFFSFSAYSEISPIVSSAFKGRNTFATQGTKETYWRPTKIRMTWEPADVVVNITPRSGLSITLGNEEIYTTSPHEFDIVWPEFSTTTYLENMLKLIWVSTLGENIEIKTFEAFGENPAYYYRVPGQPDIDRPTGGGTIQAAPLKQIKFKIDLS